MIINLRHAKIDTVNPPENLEEIVCREFAEFTKGTHRDYTFEDKLLFIDHLRASLYGNINPHDAVKSIIISRDEFELDEYGDLPDRDDYWSMEFLEHCYECGDHKLRNKEFEPFSSSASEKTMKTVLRIIAAVVNWKEDGAI